jgi:Tfp pilus assembly protein PilE
MSLVEATIILMVLAVLTSVIAPSVGDYVEEARATKAKEDVEAIGTGIMRLTRDTGLPCLTTVSTATIATGCTLLGRVDVLLSTGSAPSVTAAAVTLPTGSHGNTANATNNWPGSTSGNGVDTNPGGGDDTNVGVNLTSTVDDQLVTNSVGYTGVSFSGGGTPAKATGWRGAYLTGLTGGDPWGFRYSANTIFLTTASNASAGSTEGLLSAGWASDVIVLSAGSNGSIDTPLMSSNVSATGDDIIYVISGSSR